MDATSPQSATVPLTATSALANLNMVGFHKPEANTTAFDCSFNINDPGIEEVLSDVGVLVAGEYVKLGMKFDTSNNVLSFYINGAVQAGY